MESKNNKYKLPAGIIMSISLLLFFLFRNSSDSKHISVILVLIFTTILLVLEIFLLVKKSPKANSLLPGVVCFFLIALVEFFHDYFVRNNMNAQNITMLLMPIGLIAFLYIGNKQIASTADERRIKSNKKKFVFVVVCCVLFEMLVIYKTFIA